MKTYDVPVRVQKEENIWKVNVTQELVDPLTGGMYSMIESSIELSPNEWDWKWNTVCDISVIIL